MQRLVTDIQKEIINFPTRSAWDKGVRSYAKELFDNYIENLNIDKETVWIGKIKEKDLLNGAKDWYEYSYGGCAYIYDFDICERLCSASEQRKTKNGERKPNANEEWLDVQARALYQAARLVISIVNRKN
jgi:hypothetical protein